MEIKHQQRLRMREEALSKRTEIKKLRKEAKEQKLTEANKNTEHQLTEWNQNYKQKEK